MLLKFDYNSIIAGLAKCLMLLQNNKVVLLAISRLSPIEKCSLNFSLLNARECLSNCDQTKQNKVDSYQCMISQV